MRFQYLVNIHIGISNIKMQVYTPKTSSKHLQNHSSVPQQVYVANVLRIQSRYKKHLNDQV